MMEFVSYPKIPRFSKEQLTITEKIDGTNAVVCIFEGEFHDDGLVIRGHTVKFGSRNRWITPEDDNFGFAAWATKHAEELILLGPGRHYGEWWGKGIQRGYAQDDRHFSLFNVHKWRKVPYPPCCKLVPVLYEGPATPNIEDECLAFLKEKGSLAAPGFMNPEGIIIHRELTKAMYKHTFDKEHKGVVNKG